MNDVMQLKEGEYAPYFRNYINYTHGRDVQELLMSQINDLKVYLSTKSESWFLTPYQEGKWTPKEVIGHVIDTDRIFSYRALCLARGENSMLLGFDENLYVASADFNAVSVGDLLENFEISRKSLLAMIKTFREEAFTRSGDVNDSQMSCRACLTIIAGHFIHHMNILKERY